MSRLLNNGGKFLQPRLTNTCANMCKVGMTPNKQLEATWDNWDRLWLNLNNSDICYKDLVNSFDQLCHVLTICGDFWQFVTTLWQFCDNFVTTWWQLCDNFVINLWQLCNTFVMNFWTLLMSCVDFWRFITTCEDFVITPDDLRQFVMTCEHLWRLIPPCDNLWWLMPPCHPSHQPSEAKYFIR